MAMAGTTKQLGEMTWQTHVEVHEKDDVAAEQIPVRPRTHTELCVHLAAALKHVRASPPQRTAALASAQSSRVWPPSVAVL